MLTMERATIAPHTATELHAQKWKPFLWSWFGLRRSLRLQPYCWGCVVASRTLPELAREALQVQDACNLTGVANGFARAMVDLREHFPERSSYHGNPIVRVWIDKLADLAGASLDRNVTTSTDWTYVHDLASKP